MHGQWETIIEIDYTKPTLWQRLREPFRVSTFRIWHFLLPKRLRPAYIERGVGLVVVAWRGQPKV
jgi:hypothetical protein